MKVLQINSVCGVGSTGRIAVDLSETMTEKGIENKIVYGIGHSNYYNGINIGNKLNTRLDQLGTRVLGRHGFYSKNTTKKLIRVIEKFNPDIIHLHNIHGHYLNIRILFDYLNKINRPVVWTFHDCWPFTGHCAYFDMVGCEKWKYECKNCEQKKEYPKSWFFDRSNKNWNDKKNIFCSIDNLTIVTPSIWLSDLVKLSFLNKYPVKIINNGIDLSIFKPTKSTIRDEYLLNDKFIILGICFSLNDRKGGKYLIELAKLISDDMHIIILGLEETDDLPQNVTVIPKTNNTKELAEIYSEADVFVNPTLEDNFPTVNLESLACGTPVITFETGGSTEIIDKSTGISVNKKNIDELYNAVYEIKKNKKETYQESCIKKSKYYYDKRDKYNEYIELYYRLLREN